VEKITNYILDACALIAYLQAETGAENVKKILKDPTNQVFMHAVNFGEVYYDALKLSKEKANSLFEIIDRLPVKVLYSIDNEMIKEAGHFKANFKISYADSFVLSMAKIYNGQVVSSDHHEFDIIERKSNLKFFWIR
jgi:PIN domain nuclease of toxin-antitoxin system